jgi:hypothetical protein
MKLSLIKYLLACALFCVFSVVSFAQVLPVESEIILDRKLNIIELPNPKFKDTPHIQGIISIRITFQADGKIGEVSPVSSLTNEVTEAVIEAAKKIKFEPQIKNGKPTNLTKVLQYVFSWEYWGWKNNPEKTLDETKISQTLPLSLSYKNVRIIEKPVPDISDEIKNLKGTLHLIDMIMLRVEFLENGEIGKVVPVSSLPYGLTEVAIAAAKKIKFEPATKNGIPKSVTKSVQYFYDWDSGWRNTTNTNVESSEKDKEDKSPQLENLK